MCVCARAEIMTRCSPPSSDAGPLGTYFRRQVPEGQELCVWDTTSWWIERKQWDPTYTTSVAKIGDRLELRCREKDKKLFSEKLHIVAICNDDDAAAAIAPRSAADLVVIAVSFPSNRNFDLKQTIVAQCRQAGGWKNQLLYLRRIAVLLGMPYTINPLVSVPR